MLKELLKEILFRDMFRLILSYEPDAEKKEYFNFSFSEDKKTIAFTSVVEVTFGNSCWDDSMEVKKSTIFKNIDSYYFDSIIKDTILSEKEFKKLKVENIDDIVLYYDLFNPEFVYQIDTRPEDVDVYFNSSTVRDLVIPIEEIADYILNFKYAKSLEEIIKEANNLTCEDKREFNIKLNSLRLESILKEKEIKQTSKVKV